MCGSSASTLYHQGVWNVMDCPGSVREQPARPFRTGTLSRAPPVLDQIPLSVRACGSHASDSMFRTTNQNRRHSVGFAAGTCPDVHNHMISHICTFKKQISSLMEYYFKKPALLPESVGVPILRTPDGYEQQGGRAAMFVARPFARGQCYVQFRARFLDLLLQTSRSCVASCRHGRRPKNKNVLSANRSGGRKFATWFCNDIQNLVKLPVATGSFHP